MGNRSIMHSFNRLRITLAERKLTNRWLTEKNRQV